MCIECLMSMYVGTHKAMKKKHNMISEQLFNKQLLSLKLPYTNTQNPPTHTNPLFGERLAFTPPQGLPFREQRVLVQKANELNVPQHAPACCQLLISCLLCCCSFL